MSDTIEFGPVRHPASGPARVEVPSLQIGRGERMVIYGPNGAGKSTLLRFLAGTLGARHRDRAYAPQRPYMFRGSASHNLVLGLTGPEREMALELARRLGIEGKLGRPAGELSGGERQRLSLARVLARTVPVVLLDEPLAPIGAADQAAVIAVIAEALEGKTALIVSHERSTAAALGHRLAVMIGGRIRQIGAVGEVFALPVDEDVAAVVGMGNAIPGTVVARDDPLVRVDTAAISIWALADLEVGSHVLVLFGAEAVTVFTETAGSGSARNTWTGTIAEVRHAGRLVELLVDVGGGVRVAAVVTPGSFDALALEAGAAVRLAVKATAATAVEAPA